MMLARNVLRTQIARSVRPHNVSVWNMASRSMSSKPDDKKQQPQSILTDELLAKAGFEEPLEKDSKSEDSETSPGSSGPRARKRSRVSSKDRQRERNANWFYISTLVGSVAGSAYLARDWDNEDEQKLNSGEDVANGYTPGLMYDRFNKRLGGLFTFFQEPAFDDLLPPPPPEAYRRPLTLVLTLDDLLIHREWTTKEGWRTAKRPGLDYFLGYLSQYYEIVIFGSNYQSYSEGTVNKLDPLHAYISYALFREACRYKDGKLIKDLSLMNRDLGKMVMVDVSEDAYSLQPENAIAMAPWDGKSDDKLIKLIPFLEYLATQPVKDVRPILNSYKDRSKVVEEFAAREKTLREQFEKEQGHLPTNNANGWIAKLLGLPEQQMAPQKPKMPLDVIRENGQKQYEYFQNYLKENSAKFLEAEKQAKEELGKVTLNKLIIEGGPSPEDIAKAQAAAEKKTQGN